MSCLFFDDRVGRALRHAADCAHVGAIVAEFRVDHVGLIARVCADCIAGAYWTARVAHDTKIWFNEIHRFSFVDGS